MVRLTAACRQISRVLKDHITRFPMTDENATAFHKHLLTLYPEVAHYFDAQAVEPKKLHQSAKFRDVSAGIVQSAFNIALADTNFDGCVNSLVMAHKKRGVPFDDFKKGLPALVAMMEEKAGGCTEEEKKAWTEVFEKCFRRMNEYGYK